MILGVLPCVGYWRLCAAGRFAGITRTRPGVKGARLRKPVVGQSLDPFPREAIFLASTPERAQPVLDHMVAESADSQSVGRHGMIGKVAPDDLRQPTSLLGYRL